MPTNKNTNANSTESVTEETEAKDKANAKNRIKPIRVNKIRTKDNAYDPIRLTNGSLAWKILNRNEAQEILEPRFTDELNIDGCIYGLRLPRKLSPETLVLPNGIGNICPPAELYSRIRDAINFIFYTEAKIQLDFMAMYAFASWMFDLWQVLSYVGLTGLPGNGKSELLQCVGELCYNTYFGSGGDSDAVVFRVIDAVQGTVAIDEAQKAVMDTSSLWHKILASGNQARGSVGRMVPVGNTGDLEPQQFRVYGPKILAGRAVPGEEAILSRTTELQLKRYTLNQLEVGSREDPKWQVLASSLRNDMLTYRQRRALGLLDPAGQAYLADFHDLDLSARERQVYQWLIAECPSKLAYDSILEMIYAQRERSKRIRLNQLDVQVLLVARMLFRSKPRERILLQSIVKIIEEWGHGRTFSKTIAKIFRENELEVLPSREGSYLHASVSLIEQALDRLGFSALDLESLPSSSSQVGP